MIAGTTSPEMLEVERSNIRSRPKMFIRNEFTVASPRKKVSKWVSSIILMLVGVSFLLPLAWIVLSSIDPNASIAVTLPSGFTLEHFIGIWDWNTTFRPLLISTIIAGGAATIIVLFALLAAYPLSRYQMRFGRSFMYIVLFGTTLPITAMMVPVYALFVSLHLLNSIAGVTLFMAASGLPMAIWMTKNFMDGVPIELEEAAWIDGASTMKTLWKVVVPLMKPGIAVVFVFQFTAAWGNFFVPFVLLFDPTLAPASIAIYGFFGNYGLVSYGKLAAFAILYSLPAVVLYIVAQRVAGNTFSLAGGVKG